MFFIIADECELAIAAPYCRKYKKCNGGLFEVNYCIIDV